MTHAGVDATGREPTSGTASGEGPYTAHGAASRGERDAGADTAGANRGYTIESLDTGLRLMRLFLAHDALTVSEAAALLAVGRSTAHRVLSTLEGRGFAVRDLSGRGYSAGPELVRIGRPAGFGAPVRERVAAVLADALRRTGETVQATALLGDRIVVTDGRESPHPVRVAPQVGGTHPAHATAGGKMLLARMTPEQIRALYPGEVLPAAAPAAVGSRTSLLAELAAIRARGYAVGRGEAVTGLNTVAVPLAGASWRDRLALMASVPADRGDAPALARLAGELAVSAALLDEA
ncbi:IclR family transcriptional regulator [Streptomyces sp. NPDC056347]|uniref:IclR family transcriptional regulator n=1 Tax=Streptomyces sp. NPDC056347 TaxID=3345790 RepID=UPI0035E284D3